MTNAPTPAANAPVDPRAVKYTAKTATSAPTSIYVIDDGYSLRLCPSDMSLVHAIEAGHATQQPALSGQRVRRASITHYGVDGITDMSMYIGFEMPHQIYKISTSQERREAAKARLRLASHIARIRASIAQDIQQGIDPHLAMLEINPWKLSLELKHPVSD